MGGGEKLPALVASSRSLPVRIPPPPPSLIDVPLRVSPCQDLASCDSGIGLGNVRNSRNYVFPVFSALFLCRERMQLRMCGS
jgi:hypothetical protein